MAKKDNAQPKEEEVELNEDGLVPGSLISQKDHQALLLKNRLNAPVVDKNAEALKALVSALGLKEPDPAPETKA